MTYFAAVAAVRIQTWLARTPSLRFVRGASRVLSTSVMVFFEVTAKVPANIPVSRNSASPRRHCDAHQSVRCAPAP